jgi:hypothetical protein
LSNEITLFPTPTKAEINLSVSELVPDIITDITILDLKGQIIKRINLNNNTDKYIQLPLIEKLSSGFYILKGQTNIGNTFTKKIIVE